eukprot:CAMPEP_0204642128 /NCGR_PEP_ID=MMETSP0717-20131115/51519_1 /ASSEMBLY_ACC=CAM_ASM_000666 /TAXON_ID=230516 /ORGANISM="Chaetoceros curvisetus" /LENGTH=323 /DNA_ID=CAMNT_0051662873 /DNA_START=45 /DNA_END=1013 /DNA_ORIENTATION=+
MTNNLTKEPPSDEAPFDMSQLYSALSSKNNSPPPEPVFIIATDGIKLALRMYEPSPLTSSASPPIAALVFYHGGGAHSAAGYSMLAEGLARKYNILVYTPDIRGHGLSGGPRGDAPSAHQVAVHDIDSVLEYVVEKMNVKGMDIPILLGGHSSGGGLVLNYSTGASMSNNIPRKFKDNVVGYLMVAPQLGPQARVAHDDSAKRKDFAKVAIWPFIVNAITGTMGHNPAVKFQYPEEVLKDDTQMVIPFNTVYMANAISPTQPKDQLQQLLSERKDMVAMWMGEEDELFDVTKVVTSYFPECVKVPNATHLGILVEVHELLGPW